MCKNVCAKAWDEPKSLKSAMMLTEKGIRLEYTIVKMCVICGVIDILKFNKWPKRILTLQMS